jgi:hypothetical protein
MTGPIYEPIDLSSTEAWFWAIVTVLLIFSPFAKKQVVQPKAVKRKQKKTKTKQKPKPKQPKDKKQKSKKHGTHKSTTYTAPTLTDHEQRLVDEYFARRDRRTNEADAWK